MTLKTAAILASNELPPWLLSLVELGRFYRTCESHSSNRCNFYCINCMGVAFCPQCKNDHVKCGSRDILTIVFIQKKGGAGHPGPSNSYERCQNCSYRIKPQCSYCSIECKVEDIIRKKNSEEIVNQGGKRKSCEEADADSIVETDCKGVSPAPKSYRKRPRKGIPHRSPLF
ncbi:hypothetical protein MLD38_004627 [Melastoma candidum]|uniref:Uncharacterized protein n=1 Tax=Melastoma candidum TaxID=119954 RepID=A0ACB9SA74_9MYRT|nr:hypothetical protein MLD38_004627 [Melastoma candidum]